MRQRHRRNRVPMDRHPAAHQGYRRSRHAPSRNGLTRQHPERRLSTTLLLEKQSAVDNNRRYVSPRVRRKPFARASAGIFPGQIFQKEVSLPTLLTYRRLMSTKGVFREEGVAFTCLSPIKKATAPHQLSSCSFSPLLRPRSSARLLIYPSACSASSRFRLALSARSEPSRSRFVPTPSGVWFLRFVPALALSPCPSPVSHSRNFGSHESASFPAPSAPSSPFLGAALTYTLARVPRPLLRHPL